MLVTREDALRIVADCKLVKVSNIPHGRKALADIQQYRGKYGGGFIIKQNNKAEVYTYKNNTINKDIYNGKYSVKDAITASRTLKYINYNGIKITPTWELNLDTIDGTTLYKITESYKPIYHAGRTLTVCWYGTIDEKSIPKEISKNETFVVDRGFKATPITGAVVDGNTKILGWNNGKNIYYDINANHAQIIGHELCHAMRRTNPEAYNKLFSVVINNLSDDDMRSITNSYKEEYDTLYNGDMNKIQEEIIADLCGEVLDNTDALISLMNNNAEVKDAVNEYFDSAKY